MKKFILALVCLLAPLGVRAQVNVVGNLKDAGVTNITGSNTFVRMTLTGFGNNIPKVNGSNLIGRAFTDFHPDASGNIAGTIQGNDSITPSGTAYQVCIFDNGTSFKCNNYSVTGVGFNLNSATPLIIGPTNSSGFISAPRVFEFQQGSPSTTWTINHNFGDKNVVFDCYDTFNKYLIPDTVVQTGIGTLTITFTSAQSGSCVVMTAQNVSVTNQPANAVVTNPTNTQVVNGATTTFQSPVNMIGANLIDAYNLNNIIAVDGVKYTTLNAAMADPTCASLAGCTVDMRGNSASLALGTVDPVSNTVTVLLGPYSYTASQIVLRPGLQIMGVSQGVGLGGSPHATTITSTSTTTPMVVLGGTSAVEGVNMQNMRLYCGAGNSSQIALDIVAQVNGGGLWYSNFNNLLIGGDGTHECGGGAIVLDGSAGGSPEAINQFLNFTNVFAFRTAGGAPAFHLKGVGGQIFVANSQFDGQDPRDTQPDALIEDSAFNGFVAAYSIAFYETTFQKAGTAIKLRGSTDVSCDNCHFEDVTGIIDAAMGQHYGNFGTHILHSYCATACAQSSGSGFLTKTDAGSQLAVDYLSLFGTPDNFWTGSSIAGLEHQGLYNAFGGTPYAAPNSSMRIPVGIDSDSPGYKTQSTAITGVTAGAYAEVDVTWTTPFPDGSYVPVCNVYDFTSATTSPGLRFDRLAGGSSLDPNGLKAVVFNASGGTLNGVLFCTATHI